MIDKVKERKKLWYLKNKERLSKERKEKYLQNREEILKELKEYRVKNREKISESKKRWYQNNKEHCFNKHKKRYAIKREEILEYHKQYDKENVKKINNYKINWVKNRKKKDPQFKLLVNLRSRIRAFIKNKSSTTKELIGCSLDELKLHIEKQFKPGMNWENWSSKGWHIDHIIPLASAKTEEELYKLCHYTNLQPLWAKENLSKGDRIILENGENNNGD